MSKDGVQAVGSSPVSFGSLSQSAKSQGTETAGSVASLFDQPVYKKHQEETAGSVASINLNRDSSVQGNSFEMAA